MHHRRWTMAIAASLGAVATAAHAQTPMGKSIKEGLFRIGRIAGFFPDPGEPRTFPQVMGAYVNGMLTLLGLLFLIMIIRGGVIWMTAGGEEEKARQAKLIIKNSVYGLAIVLLARIFTNFYLGFLAPAVTTP